MHCLPSVGCVGCTQSHLGDDTRLMHGGGEGHIGGETGRHCSSFRGGAASVTDLEQKKTICPAILFFLVLYQDLVFVLSDLGSRQLEGIGVFSVFCICLPNC